MAVPKPLRELFPTGPGRDCPRHVQFVDYAVLSRWSSHVHDEMRTPASVGPEPPAGVAAIDQIKLSLDQPANATAPRLQDSLPEREGSPVLPSGSPQRRLG